ncbi:hypothetical protein I79_014430 [Cricetulus griseus]|uniref:Uncharacterized protein n=1 Tax=Cricetulus griseus TaxID=10029 RepID=G3HU27_CRIGR|nr:hypothetical protein I79_014430 [Cricetulus griseus]
MEQVKKCLQPGSLSSPLLFPCTNQWASQRHTNWAQWGLGDSGIMLARPCHLAECTQAVPWSAQGSKIV